MEYRINNAELVLLILIAERARINGYQIRKAVIDRGMEAWAGVSTSSIYVMLRKLETRELVSSQEDTQKRTKGARGQVYSISPRGKSALRCAIQSALSECREHDPRFNIALSGLENMDIQEAALCLKKRCLFLALELGRLVEVEESQGHLPLPAMLLFDHVKDGIQAEVGWLERIIAELAKKEIQDDHDS